MNGGAYEVCNYRNTVDIIANYRLTVDIFHVITDFCLRHVVQSPNTEHNLPKLSFHRPKKLSNTVHRNIVRPLPPMGVESAYKLCKIQVIANMKKKSIWIIY